MALHRDRGLRRPIYIRIVEPIFEQMFHRYDKSICRQIRIIMHCMYFAALDGKIRDTSDAVVIYSNKIRVGSRSAVYPLVSGIASGAYRRSRAAVILAAASTVRACRENIRGIAYMYIATVAADSSVVSAAASASAAYACAAAAASAAVSAVYIYRAAINYNVAAVSAWITQCVVEISAAASDRRAAASAARYAIASGRAKDSAAVYRKRRVGRLYACAAPLVTAPVASNKRIVAV
jgi:hypothetical protein